MGGAYDMIDGSEESPVKAEERTTETTGSIIMNGVRRSTRTRKPASGVHKRSGLPLRVLDLEPEVKVERSEPGFTEKPIPRSSIVKKVVDESSESSSDEFASDYGSEATGSSDDSDIGFKPSRTPLKKSQVKRGRGRPRKYPKVEKEKPEAQTKFVHVTGLSKGWTYLTSSRRQIQSEKREFILQSDAFQSPRKQKEGILLLSKTPSPSKRGVPFSLSPIRRTPQSGRAGSPKKLQKMELQDMSARKKANRTLYSRLIDAGADEDSHYNDNYQENISIAEKIILESRSNQSSVQSTPFNTPRKQLKPFDLPTHDPNFVPTPLPTRESDQEFFEGKYHDKALFLDGPEGYFEQHISKVKPSHNSMVQAPHLDYDEFNSFVLFSGFLHYHQKVELSERYKQMWHQYAFELNQGFNLVFYGIGSKRTLLLEFVEEYLLDRIDVPVVVVNGYNPAVKFGEVLSQIVNVLNLKQRVPKRHNEAIDFLIEHFKTKVDQVQMILLIHNIDGESFRDEKIQDYLARLAAIEQFYLIASIDHINAPLLWDSMRLSKFNFVWHNATTFQDYTTEISFRDPLLLGQTQKAAGSQGAKYVLSSLTHSSKGLYRILAAQQLRNMQEALKDREMSQSTSVLKGQLKYGIEFPQIFRLCVEEFITSNEVNFRTMLMEFVEHKMCVLTRDQPGMEVVYIPYSYDEIQQLLAEELRTNRD